MLTKPHFVPAWLTVHRPSSIFTKGKNLMSLLAKILTKKDAAVPASVQLDRDLDKAIGAALSRNVNIHSVLDSLSRQENSLRHRMAAGLRF
jgi:hypothetical protein